MWNMHCFDSSSQFQLRKHPQSAENWYLVYQFVLKTPTPKLYLIWSTYIEKISANIHYLSRWTNFFSSMLKIKKTTLSVKEISTPKATSKETWIHWSGRDKTFICKLVWIHSIWGKFKGKNTNIPLILTTTSHKLMIDWILFLFVA